MKHLQALRFAVYFAVACSAGWPVTAKADWTYKTRITIFPDASNKPHLPKKYATTGFVTTGATTVFFDAKTAYVKTPVPNLSDPVHPSSSISLFDGTNTYSTLSGIYSPPSKPIEPPAGRVELGDQVSGLASPPGKMLLGRFEVAGKSISSGSENGSKYKISEYPARGNATLRTKTMLAKDGKILSIAMYFVDRISTLIARYDVKAYDENGVASAVKITYFQGAGTPRRIDEFWLTRSTPPVPKTPSDVFQPGQLVWDVRLDPSGADQVHYDWEGIVPTMSELRFKRSPLVWMKGSGSLTKFIPVGLVFLLAGGTWLVMRRRTKVRAILLK